LDDLIVGVSNARSNAGKSYVVFGKANSSAINLKMPLQSLVASPLITKPPVGLLASAIALRLMVLLLALPNGDVNGDGLDDLIVGARYADPSGKSKAGKSYPSPLTSPALETEKPFSSFAASPLITKPPVGFFASAMVLRSIALLPTLPDASNPTGGFVINGEAENDRSGYSVSSTWISAFSAHNQIIQWLSRLCQPF
jgi:hypothetical protein